MPILSKRMMNDVARSGTSAFGLRPWFMDLAGRIINVSDPLEAVSGIRRRRDYALQQSVNMGAPCAHSPGPGLSAQVVGLEHRRMICGALMTPVIRLNGAAAGDAAAHLSGHGLSAGEARRFVSGLPAWPAERIEAFGCFLQETFYRVSGWVPQLMRENRLKALQQEQINRAIEDQRRHGKPALYAFEKERALLANIRAGDRSAARSILNEMLATIYMSSPQLVVLRARAIELISCLTRAAIEDNPLMEPLIERNHMWTERLVKAAHFEKLSEELMSALDGFIDGIYLHGANRSNAKVHEALDCISRRYAQPISLSEIARQVSLSPCRLAHLVKQLTGRTVVQIIHETRVRRAQHLLERSSLSCTEIAYEVGFGDQSYFIKQFRRLTGTTPGRYRRVRRRTASHGHSVAERKPESAADAASRKDGDGSAHPRFQAAGGVREGITVCRQAPPETR